MTWRQHFIELIDKQGMQTSWVRGAHLFDLVCGLSLVAITIVIAMPVFTNWHTQWLLKSETDKLTHTFEKLTLEALQREILFRVELQENAYSIYLETDPRTHLRSYTFPVPIKVVLVNDEPKELYFHRSGVASPQTLILTNGERACRITVSLRSRVRTDCDTSP